MKNLLFFVIALSISNVLTAQQIIPLYNGAVPNSIPTTKKEHVETSADGSVRISQVIEPTLKVFLPAKEKRNGAAVIICPGGGYVRLSSSREGDDVAKVLAGWGVTAFVLKYRLPDDSIMQNKEIVPLQDAQHAIQLVRQRASEWNIDTKKVGIMGFSAGGHVASTLGTHFKKALIPNKPRINLRPDFMILMYPVVSFTDSLAHKGSRDHLIGVNPSQDKIKLYSNEMRSSFMLKTIKPFPTETVSLITKHWKRNTFLRKYIYMKKADMASA